MPMMKDPPHPGGTVREDCIEAEGLTVTEAARILGVTRPTLSRVLNGRGGISPEMAIRFEKVGWSSAEFWMRLQTYYDLAQARANEDRINVEPLEPTAVAAGS
ncbi:MAG: HigA family addiction module antitoxin [bacterium]|nr:HigA family addiction module antitoxin [bacterium]